MLNSGVLKISRESTSIIIERAHNGIRDLPPLHFSFGVVDLGRREEVVKSELVTLQGIAGLKNAERASLEETIITRLVRPPASYGSQIQAQLESDLRSNTPALKEAIKQHMRMDDIAISSLEIRVEETDTKTFHIITNLTNFLKISDEEAHNILKNSVSAVANLNQRLADMQAYSAITGFTQSEAPLLFGKFAGIIAPQNPNPVEKQFGRVISVANLPDFVPDKKIDVDALLAARESSECREFRAWLLNLEAVSDSQISEMIGGIRNKVALMIRSNFGKTMRFAANTAIGLIPGIGIVAGPAAGAIDSFLIERVFPTSGVLAFLVDIYPSLFTSA